MAAVRWQEPHNFHYRGMQGDLLGQARAKLGAAAYTQAAAATTSGSSSSNDGGRLPDPAALFRETAGACMRGKVDNRPEDALAPATTWHLALAPETKTVEAQACRSLQGSYLE